MYTTRQNLRAAAAYSNTSVQTDVLEASPHKLILMLYDGALLSLNLAKVAIEEKTLAEKIKQITKAIDIISLGLKASLDVSLGGELVLRLDALYDYMCARLAFANATNTVAPIDEVAGLLRELREAWEIIGDTKESLLTKSYEEV